MTDQLAHVRHESLDEPLSTEGLLRFQQLPVPTAICDHLYEHLRSAINWQEDYFETFNRRFSIPRLQAWYADHGLQYRYANNLMKTQAWIDPLLQLRQLVSNATGIEFNALLATCYRNGDDHVTWHSDDERELGSAPVIASLSLGATRRFEFRHKEMKLSSEVLLKHGDFLVMEPAFQHYWEHQVPPEPGVKECRINLTFRRVYQGASR